MASLHDLLRPITLTKVVSQVAESNSELLTYFGVQPGGKNEVRMGHGREGSFHVFNNVREVGIGRAPGMPAGRIKRNAVGRVPFTYPRMHYELSLLAEEIHNLAKIDDPRTRDEAGETYIRMQTKPISQRAANWRTAMLVGMIRDSLYILEDGDDWYFSYTSTGAKSRINYQMPAGNQTQLNMLGDGNIIDASWDDPATDIPKQLLNINAAFQELNGGRLQAVICRSSEWRNIINNDYVAGHAGIANSPFRTFRRQLGTGPDGTPINAFIGEIVSMPGVEFYITDDGLDIGSPNGTTTFTPHIETGKVAFLGASPGGGDAYSMYLGSEPVSDAENAPEVVRTGLYVWSKRSFNPTGREIFALDNALLVNHVPNSTAYGTVVF